MTVPTNTIQNVSRVGVREDLANKIAELFPDDTPFLNAIPTGKCSATKTEWQTDGLASANPNNAQIQGDDLANDSRTNTSRVSTYSQISTKVVGVSTTVEATNKSGRKSELAREIMKAGRELRTDMEARACGNYAAVAPAAGTAGQTAGALAWLTSNASRGTGGAGGGYNGTITTAATNGTQRAYAEAQLKDVLQKVWAKGGNPKLVITAGSQKQTAAGFAGLAQQRRETGNRKATIIAGADIYVSDFGEVQFVPSRFCSPRDALVVDPDYWEIGVLDPLGVQDLAKTGLSTRKMLSVEWALKCLNESASGVVADLT